MQLPWLFHLPESLCPLSWLLPKRKRDNHGSLHPQVSWPVGKLGQFRVVVGEQKVDKGCWGSELGVVKNRGISGLCQTRKVSVDGKEEFPRRDLVERTVTGNLYSEPGVCEH